MKNRGMARLSRAGAALLFAILLAGCAGPPPADSSSLAAPPSAAAASKAPSGAAKSPAVAPPASSAARPDAGATEWDVYYKAYAVEPGSFETALPAGTEIPVASNYGEGTVEDDLMQCEAMLGHATSDIQPFYKSAYFEYGHRFEHRRAYKGAYCLTSPDGIFDGTVAHRFDVTLLKDGQPTGEGGRYYVAPREDFQGKVTHLMPYFYDEGAGMLRYVQIGQSFASLAGVESGIKGAGMMQPEGAVEDAGHALAAYVEFLGGSNDMDVLNVSFHSFIIPPSASDEDWYSLYFFREDRGEENRASSVFNHEILDGLIYRNEADPTLWQVYDGPALGYRALRLENGRFAAA